MGRISSRALGCILAGVLGFSSLVMPLSASAYNMLDDGKPTSGDMLADMLMIRPFSLVSTVAGTAVFIVSLPFNLLDSNIGEAANTLVAEPFKYTFARPLGEYDDRTINGY
jgi:hypothetical protein